MKTPKITLILISGPPGIGKTQFTCDLVNYILEAKPELQPIKLHYDQLIDKQLETSLIENNEWKRGREDVKTLVQLFIEYLSQLYTSSCKHFEGYLAKIPQTTGIDFTIKQNFLCSIEKLGERSNEVVHYFILLDDNFYYESMRYSFFKFCLASSSECSYFSISFRTDNLQLLVARNCVRNVATRVSQSVLVNMLAKFEYSKDCSWESKFCLQITDVNEILDFGSILNMVAENDARFLEFRKERIQEKERLQINNPDYVRNFVHECDLMLRKLVKEKLLASIGIMDKKETERVGRQLAEKKTNILSQIKEMDSELHKKLWPEFCDGGDFNLIENELRLKLLSD